MPTLKTARAYAEQGIAVLPVVEPDHDICSCPLGAACKSPGKHPVSALAPHGVHDATTDAEKLGEYFSKPTSIGVACGKVSGGLMVFDVDNSHIADMLLDERLAIWNQTAMAETRRGVHIYMRSLDVSGTIHLRTSDGAKIGELRGDGAYVVAPPSKRFGGGNYRWLGNHKGIPPIKQVDSALDYIMGLLTNVGVNIAPFRPLPTLVDIPITGIEPKKLPWRTKRDESRLRQFLTGTAPTNDRSGRLTRIAYEIVASAVRHNENIDPRDLAGVLKRTDAVQMQKYSHRADGDFQYLRIAQRALSTIPTEEQAETLDELAESADYVFEEGIGLFKTVHGKNGDSLKAISNFKIDIVSEEVTVEKTEVKERAFYCQLEHADGTEALVTLLSNEVTDNRKLADAIETRAGGKYQILLEAGRFLWEATKVLAYASKPPPTIEIPANTGWIKYEGRDGFVLPVEDHGIILTPTAIVPIKFSTPDHLKGYGVGVRPMTADDVEPLTEAVNDLFNLIPTHILMPLFLQLIGAPIVGQHDLEPALVHVSGESGAYKTTLAMVLLNLYGRRDKTAPPGSWGHTMNALQSMMHEVCDLPFLIDDYKQSRLRGANQNEVTALIQNYADRQGRVRLGARRTALNSATWTAQSGPVPRSLVISTGEQAPDKEPSVQARMVLIDVVKGEITPEAIAQLQSHVMAGHMAVLGGGWLGWLARRGIDHYRLLVTEYHDEARADLLSHAAHPRIAHNLALLYALGRIFSRFLGVRLPGARPLFLTRLKEWWATSSEQLEKSSKEIKETTAFEQIAEAIREKLPTPEIRIAGIKARSTITRMASTTAILSRDNDLGGGAAYGLVSKIVGYHDGENIYLSKGLTLQWFSQHQRPMDERLTFDWKSLVREAEALGGHQIIVSKDLRNGRFVRVPRDLILMKSPNGLNHAKQLT